MNTQRFFIRSDQVRDGSATLTGSDADHLARSLRARPGERIVVVEDGHTEHGLELERVTTERVSGRITWSRPATGEPALTIHVLQALPATGMDDAIESLSEAGVSVIWPVTTARTVPRLDRSRHAGRAQRWERIAREAAQLAARAQAPVVQPLLPLADALTGVPANALLVACVVAQAAIPLHALDLGVSRPPALAIGPEGGFDSRDLDLLRDAGAVLVHLGPRVLPSRLAGAIAVSLLLARAGDLDIAMSPPPL